MFTRPSTVTLALGMLAASGCAGSSGGVRMATAPGYDAAQSAAPAAVVAGASATLAGARCQSGRCVCRNRNAPIKPEEPPPADGQKRFEVRLAAEGGSATLDIAGVGRFDAGDTEACFYVDLAAGDAHDVTLLAKEGRKEGGVGPSLAIAEYGPKGPYWYDVIEVHCDGPGGKCTRDAADAWAATLRSRKRGRLDPCGSAVVSHLGWDTTGGAGLRDAGLFRDFTVKFTMEVKKFATQFAPGSTECVPK